MIICLLGATAVGDELGTMREPPGQVPSAVLAHLALARGHVLTPDALGDRVWDSPPDNPRNALQAAVSRLRKAYSPGIVESTRAGYRIDVAHVQVDIIEAERAETEARAAAREGDLQHAAQLAQEGLDWFRGDALAGLDSQAAEAARVNAEELRQRLILLLGEALLAGGRADEAAALLWRACTEAPLAEPVHGLLMRALVADGRSNDALTVYDGLRRRLADELGSDPSPEITAIFAAILAGEHETPPRRSTNVGPPLAVEAPQVSGAHDIGILMTDVVGSTRLWAEHAEVMPEVMLAHHALVAEVVKALGGRLPPDQGEGDARLAVFPNAGLAARAGGALQQRLDAATWPGGRGLNVRMGVHAGSVVEAGGNVFGTPIHKCARLRGLAHGRQVLLTGVAAELAADQLTDDVGLTRLGRVTLRDFDGDEEVFQLDWPGCPATFPPLRISVRLPSDVASFVGRRADVEALVADVLSHRLVTVTGLGGSGKTRLSVQAARLAAPALPGGVTFVDVASATSASEAFELLFSALELTAADSSAEGLRNEVAADSLLVLDNLEQMDDVVTFVSGVLDSTPARVLATSRVPVGVPGECVRPIAPLSEADALALLRTRAEDYVPGLQLDDTDARRLADLLDGVPLAVELAAARLRVLSASVLADSLDAALSLLVDTNSGRPTRHHAVEALLDDAWVQVGDDGRRVLATLSVARTPAAIVAVIDVTQLDAVVVLDATQELVSRGLIRPLRGADGSPVFQVLELVRRVALRRTDPETMRAIRRAHTEAVLGAVVRAPEVVLAQSREDVREAIRGTIGGEDVPGARDLTSASRLALGRVALSQGWWAETIGLLEPAARLAEAANPLGVALLRRAEPGDVERGRRLLAKAAKAGDVDAAAALGGSYRGRDPHRAYGWYVAALDLDDSDPYALGNVLEFEVHDAQSLAPVAPRRAQLSAAVNRRQSQAEAGEDLPWPWFDLAKFELLLGHDLVGLHRLLDAVATSTHERQLATSLTSLAAMTLPSSKAAWTQAAEVLRVAARVRFPAPRVVGDGRIESPVLVLVGASAPETHEDVLAWLEPLRDGLEELSGTVVSGGTAQGVSALAAAVCAELPDWHSLGFAPSTLPSSVALDTRYDEVRRSSGTEFSLLEPVAYWDAIAGAGIRAADVRVLGIGGTDLTHLELHLALALGASVAVAGSPTGSAPDGGSFARWASLRQMDMDGAAVRTWLLG